MATEAPSVGGRSSQAAYSTLIRSAGSCSGAEWSHPLFSGSRNKRWLDFARHDSLNFPAIPAGKLLSNQRNVSAKKKASHSIVRGTQCCAVALLTSPNRLHPPGSRMNNVRLRRTRRTRHPHNERYNRFTALVENSSPAPAANKTQNFDSSDQQNCWPGYAWLIYVFMSQPLGGARLCGSRPESVQHALLQCQQLSDPFTRQACHLCQLIVAEGHLFRRRLQFDETV